MQSRSQKQPLITRRRAVAAGLTVAAGWLVTGCSVSSGNSGSVNTASVQTYAKALIEPDDALRSIDEDGFMLFDDDEALSLLWFTDIHGSAENLARIVAWREAHSAYIDDALCTGDMVYSNYGNDFDYWTECGAAGTLTCIGNHDRNGGPKGFDYSEFSQADAYDRYLYPFIGLWGNTITWTSGKTYYYKDYPAQKIRLIVLDSTEQDDDLEAELAWFKDTLDETRALGYTVLAATHFMPASEGKIACNFSSIEQDPIPSSMTIHVLPTMFADAVDAFKQAGGSFACWLCGHYHVDMLCHPEGHADQLVVVQACAVCWNTFGDLDREEGTASQDCFDYFTIHPASHRLRIARIGASETHAGAHRGTITVDYATMEVLASS